MKFLKQSQLNFRNVRDQSVAVTVDGGTDNPLSPRIIMENTNSLQIPRGSTIQRPDSVVWINGMMRYNTITDQFEFRQANQWRNVRFKESTQIVQQALGAGDSAEIFFGPLSPAPPSTVESGASWGPQNLLVYIENVPQLSISNYVVQDNPSVVITGSVSLGSVTFDSTDITRTMTGATITGPGVPSGTTVSTLISGNSLTLSAAATEDAEDQLYTVSYAAGWYIRFDSPVPYGKPVTVIHGTDR
jgi:hypothetical protein